MTLPVTPNGALVPRQAQAGREEQKKGNTRKNDIQDEPVVEGFAPHTATMHTRVRALDSETDLPPVDGNSRTGAESQARIVRGVSEPGKDGKGIVMKIEAEVTVVGDLPEEGVAVETITFLRPVQRSTRDMDNG